MKRFVAAILVLVMAMVCFTGCMYREDIITVNEDGSGQSYSKIMIEKAVYDQFAESMGVSEEENEMSEAKVEIVDDVEYYVMEETVDFASYAELKDGLEASGYTGVYASKNGVRYVFSSGTAEEDVEAMKEMGLDLSGSLKASIAITMPQEIVKTTGTLSDDKKTANFVFEGDALYDTQDVMVSVAAETTKPTISGITNKKTYGSAKTITARDASGIKTAKYKIGSGKYDSFNITKTFTKNGTYTVYATDYYGNKTVRTFTIKDTTKPKVSGVTNNKTYTSDRNLTFSDNCAVKTVKLYRNGTRITLTSDDIEYGVIVSKTGSYKVIVTDVNGNSRTVYFKIK